MMSKNSETRGQIPKKNGMLMTEGSIFRCLLFFAVPLILGNLLQQTYNAVDSIIVGNYVGRNGLAAVGSSTSLILLLISFSQGAAIGAGVIVSQYLGARDRDNVQSAVHTALSIAGGLGLLLSLIGAVFSRQILEWMNTPEEVLVNSAVYLRIFSCGLVFNVLYNMCAGILNAAGNSKRSLRYLAVASVTNIILDLLLICVFQLGVAGAAIATTISQALSMCLALRFLLRVPSDYQVSFSKLGIRPQMAKRIVFVGLPTGIQNMLISLSNVIVQTSVNHFGAAAMAGFGAYMKIDGFNVLPLLSIGMSMTTFVGQNYGAGRYDRIKKGIRISVCMALCYTAVTSTLLLLFSNEVMRLFTSDPTVIAYAVLAMRYFCPFYWTPGVLHALAGAVRGTGKTIPPMIVLILSFFVFRVLWIRLVLPFFDSMDGVLIQYPVCWTLGMLMMILYVWKGKWLKK